MNQQHTTGAQPDRGALIDRIRKLAKFTTAAGCSEAEAASAAAKVAELIAQYDITADELRVRADARGCITDIFVELTATRSDWMNCAVAIARLYSCKVWREHDMADPLGIGLLQRVVTLKFFGFPSDVAACVATCSIIHTALDTEAAAIRGRTKHASHLRESFRAGMIDRLRERLQEMHEQRTQARRAATGSALIVLKDALVTEEFAKLNLRLDASRGTAAKSYDGAAYAAGRGGGAREAALISAGPRWSGRATGSAMPGGPEPWP